MRLKRENISTFAIMKQFLLFIFLSLPCCLLAQNERAAHVKPEDRKISLSMKALLPEIETPAEEENEDAYVDEAPADEAAVEETVEEAPVTEEAEEAVEETPAAEEAPAEEE